MTETNAVKVLPTYVLMILICIKSYQHPIWPSYLSNPKISPTRHFLQPTLWFTCLALFLNTISTSLSYLCHFQLPGRTKVLYFRSQKCCVFWTNHKKERHKNHLNHNDVIFTILTWCVTAAVFSLTPIKYLIKRTGTSWVDWRKKNCFFFSIFAIQARDGSKHGLSESWSWQIDIIQSW